MVSYQLESDVEVSPRPTRGINVVAMASMSQILMVALLFENHFVVELLWPRRERRARMNPVVVSNIFNALLAIFKNRTRCRVLIPLHVRSKYCCDGEYVAGSKNF